MSRNRFLLCLLFHVVVLVSTVFAERPRGYFTEPIDVNPVGFGSAIDAATLDDLTLYFSNCGHPTCGQQNGGNIDIWMATRQSTDEPFDNAVLIEELNTNSHDGLATIVDEGRSLYLLSDRNGDWDLYHSSRESPEGVFSEPLPIDELNTENAQLFADLSADEKTIVYAQGATLEGETQLWIAQRSNKQSTFEDPRPVFDDAFNDGAPTLSSDGLTLFFNNRASGPRRPRSRGNTDVYVAFRESTNVDFGEPINLDDAFSGTTINTNEWHYIPFISPKWPAPGSLLYFSAAESHNNFQDTIMQSTWVAQGDIDMDHEFTSADVDSLMSAIRDGTSGHVYDMDGSGERVPDDGDLRAWVHDIKVTWFGDANLDGEFNSSDFVQVFQAGEYEDGITFNSTWQTGDWNGDGEFDSADFVKAFQDGGFEKGPRLAVLTPEPNGFHGLCLLTIACVVMLRRDGDCGSPVSSQILNVDESLNTATNGENSSHHRYLPS